VNSGLSPTASFTYAVDACTQSIKFNNTSTNGGSFIWNFGDASPLDSNSHPVHGYSSAGNYSVTLTAFVGQGCTNSVTQTITAPQWSGVYPPNAIFSYGVEACTNTITATGNPSNYTLHKWLWDGQDLGWGSMISIPNPSIGGHNLTYIVGYGACYDTTSRYIQIQDAPVAGFDIASNTCSNTIVASNISKNANTFSWNFGDPSTLLDTAVGNTASYTYPNNGTFNLQLIAKDLYGCADTVEQNVTVSRAFNAHIANFTFDNSLCNCKCQNLIRFENLTPGNNNAYLWTFGDGTSSTKVNPSKGFATAGIYQVTLTTVDSVGCMSSVTKMVNIPEGLKGPSASFNTDYQVQCVDNNNFNFYNTSSYMGSGWNTKYYWNFGDGTKDSTNSFIFNKKYTTPGNYIVTLIAEGNEGCKDTMTMFIQVRPNPCTGVLRLVNLADGTNWNVNPDFGGGATTGLAKVNKALEFGLYPNPNDGTFTINFSQRLSESFNLEIRDMTGRMVFEQLNIENGLREVNISAGQLSEGAYILRVLTSEGNISEKKFIVVR
jgi:PKD repeat protein